MPEEESLFGESRQEFGEGTETDAEGNVYDKDGNLAKEAPSPGLLMARKQHPGWSDRELAPLAKIYNNQLESKKTKISKKSK